MNDKAYLQIGNFFKLFDGKHCHFVSVERKSYGLKCRANGKIGFNRLGAIFSKSINFSFKSDGSTGIVMLE